MEKDTKKIKIAEIFDSIQGEGSYQGYPVTFIRVSGCTRACSFCDSKYHTHGTYWSINQIVQRLRRSKSKIVIWTGGSPLIYRQEIINVIEKLPLKDFHLETNGDLIRDREDLIDLLLDFSYICISPKDLKTAKKAYRWRKEFKPLDLSIYNLVDIKVVTDLDTVGVDMIKYATTLMPLTTGNLKKDNQIRRRVWEYCVKHHLFYSARLHVSVWGVQRRKK